MAVLRDGLVSVRRINPKSLSYRAAVRLSQQEFFHEQDRRVELEVHVRLLLEAVALVPGHEVPHGDVAPLEGRHHLFRLAARHARSFMPWTTNSGLVTRSALLRGALRSIQACVVESRSSPY